MSEPKAPRRTTGYDNLIPLSGILTWGVLHFAGWPTIEATVLAVAVMFFVLVIRVVQMTH